MTLNVFRIRRRLGAPLPSANPERAVPNRSGYAVESSPQDGITDRANRQTQGHTVRMRDRLCSAGSMPRIAP